jgi:DNA mismatch repair ATPase MutS
MKLIESLETLYPVLSECSDYIATIDIYSSHALFALQHKLVKPTLTNTGTTSIHE